MEKIFKNSWKKFFLVWVAGGLLSIYLLFVAVDFYQSEATFVIKSSSTVHESVPAALSLLGGMNTNSRQGVFLVREYVRSFEMLNRLDQEFELQKGYTSNRPDFLRSLSFFYSRKDLLDLYRKHVSVQFDDVSGIATVRFLDSDPTRARRVLEVILAEGEKFLNGVNHQVVEEELTFVREWVVKSGVQLEKTIRQMTEFQNKANLLDPKEHAAAVVAIVAQIEGKLATKKIELSEVKEYMREESYQVKKLSQEVAKLQDQLSKQRLRLASQEGGKAVNDQIVEYEQIKARLKLDAESYKSSLVALEKARLEAVRKARKLVVVTPPAIPDEPRYPQRAYVFCVGLILAFLAQTVLRFGYRQVQDHKE